MNEEQRLQLQAWIDGELPEGEIRQVEALLDHQSEAKALAEELKFTKGLLAGNEPETRVPESREFYWSRIRREIERLEATPAEPPLPSWLMAWRRFLTPLSGLALAAFLSVLSLHLFQRPDGEEGGQHLVEVENLSEHVGSISYKSQSENMFVVYLYNKEQEAENDDEFQPVEDSVLQ